GTTSAESGNVLPLHLQRERRHPTPPLLDGSMIGETAVLQASVLEPRSRGFLLDLRVGLVGRLLLVLQSFFRSGIRRRRRYIRRLRARIWRFRNATRTLLLRQFAQAGIELFREVVLHLLQVVHFNGYSLSGPAFRLLARRDAGVHHIVGIGSVGEPRDYVTRAQRTFLPVRHYGEIAGHDKGAPCRIQRRRNFVAGIRRCCCLSRWSGGRASLRRLCLLRGQLRLYFLGDGLLDFGSHCHLARRRCRSRTTSASVAGIGVRTCLPLGGIGRLQIRRNQVIRQPERRRSIDGIRREPPAVEAKPRSSSPTPRPYTPDNWRRPRVIGPPVKAGIVEGSRIVAVVVIAAVVVAAIHAGPVVAVVIVRARIIGVAAAVNVAALHVSAVPSRVHDARSVVFTHNRAPAVDPMLNVHAAAINRTNLAIGTDACLSSTLQRNVPARRSVAARALAGVRWSTFVATARWTALGGATRRTTLVAARTAFIGIRSAGSAVGRACRASSIRARCATPVGVRSAGSAVGRACRTSFIRTPCATSVGARAAGRVSGRAARFGTTGRSAGLGTTGRSARLGTAARGGFRRWLARRCLRSGGLGGRCTRLLLSRSHCGYREKNQQYGPNRQDVLSSVARIH